MPRVTASNRARNEVYTWGEKDLSDKKAARGAMSSGRVLSWSG